MTSQYISSLCLNCTEACIIAIWAFAEAWSNFTFFDITNYYFVNKFYINVIKNEKIHHALPFPTIFTHPNDVHFLVWHTLVTFGHIFVHFHEFLKKIVFLSLSWVDGRILYDHQHNFPSLFVLWFNQKYLFLI